jgi:hypothetical protein
MNALIRNFKFASNPSLADILDNSITTDSSFLLIINDKFYTKLITHIKIISTGSDKCRTVIFNLIEPAAAFFSG